MEVSIGMLLAQVRVGILWRAAFKQIAQVTLKRHVGIGLTGMPDAVSAIEDGRHSRFQSRLADDIHITCHITVIPHHHVAVHEEQPIILRLPGQEIAYPCPSHIGLPLDVAAMLQWAYSLTVGLHGCPVRRPVVGHQHLECQSFLCRSLMLQRTHQLSTHIIICGNQYGESLSVCF